MVAIKGDAVRFIAGKYGGMTGWINTQERGDKKHMPVIVDLGRKGERATYVLTASIKRISTTPPSGYAEAVLQQCPKIEKNLVMVTRQLAKCDISRDPQGFIDVVGGKLEAACKWQESKGTEAMYRKIKFEPETRADKRPRSAQKN